MLLLWAVASVARLYTEFVLQNLWTWFATLVFHLLQISFWVMYWLVLVIGMFADDKQKERRPFQGVGPP